MSRWRLGILASRLGEVPSETRPEPQSEQSSFAQDRRQAKQEQSGRRLSEIDRYSWVSTVGEANAPPVGAIVSAFSTPIPWPFVIESIGQLAFGGQAGSWNLFIDGAPLFNVFNKILGINALSLYTNDSVDRLLGVPFSSTGAVTGINMLIGPFGPMWQANKKVELRLREEAAVSGASVSLLITARRVLGVGEE